MQQRNLVGGENIIESYQIDDFVTDLLNELKLENITYKFVIFK